MEHRPNRGVGDSQRPGGYRNGHAATGQYRAANCETKRASRAHVCSSNTTAESLGGVQWISESSQVANRPPLLRKRKNKKCTSNFAGNALHQLVKRPRLLPTAIHRRIQNHAKENAGLFRVAITSSFH